VKKTFALATLLVLSALPAYAWTTFFGQRRVECIPNVFGGVNCR